MLQSRPQHCFQPAEVARRSDHGIEVLQRRFARDMIPGRERFLREMENYLLPLSRVETAEFEIVSIKEIAGLRVDV